MEGRRKAGVLAGTLKPYPGPAPRLFSSDRRGPQCKALELIQNYYPIVLVCAAQMPMNAQVNSGISHVQNSYKQFRMLGLDRTQCRTIQNRLEEIGLRYCAPWSKNVVPSRSPRLLYEHLVHGARTIANVCIDERVCLTGFSTMLQISFGTV